MAELKTKETSASAETFLEKACDKERFTDCQTVLRLMQAATGEKPVMWGKSIVGFGRYSYKYKSGRSGEWMLTGFSPRKSSLSLYIMSGFDAVQDLMPRLGKYKSAEGCLYVKRLADVDLVVLKEIIERSVKIMTTGDMNR